MKLKIIIIVFVLVFLIGLCPFTKAEDDWQYWHKYSFNKKLTEKLYAKVEPVLKLKEDIGSLTYWETTQGVLYKFDKHWESGVYYLFAQDQDSKGKWTDEHRGRFDTTYKWPWGNCKLSDRNRYEYRVIGAKPRSRYRNQIKLAYPFKKFTPYISNEFFYDFRVDEYNQNRAAVGFEKKLTDNMALDLQFFHRADKGKKDWKGTEVIESTIKINF